ncbi:phosphocholine-specific phospholipase C [Flavihumibacter solisilvae]|uniref:phospholipase C n=1 Tax=Flavihumibacter solisilvae TaxID=1349421 RepID=A0A0C1LKA9_9BACT|nr:phospholipase C, phosphocholine-specific [Flavihumibacter solisilvae]KIC95803.1 phospholipase C [Flavihumibacter solisilvae]
MSSRREFLKKVSLATGGAGIWTQMPAAIQKALAIDPEKGSTFYDAEHIVLLMQENRSFDHCFGRLQGVRGFNDPRAIRLPDGNPVWIQPNKSGQAYAPFRLNIKDTKATWMSSLPHSWEDQQDARNHGRYDGWIDAKRPGNKKYRDIPMTMGYYDRQDIPFYYALADSFTVCDQHFCASLTGTTANRSFFWTGSTRDGKEGMARVRNEDLYFNREGNWKTFPERLEENDISWKVYQNEISLQTELDGEDEAWLSNFTDNNLEWFSQFNVRFSKAHYQFLQKRVKELPGEIADLESQVSRLAQNEREPVAKKLKQKKEQLSKYKEDLVTWNPENFERLTEFQKSLHRKAFVTNSGDPDYHRTEMFSYTENGEERSTLLPKGDILHQFREDVNKGVLPTVSWLVAPQNFSDHPSAPWFGAWYVSEVLDILTRNPEVWKKTIFVLTYDENDGYFDHIPPFVAPKPGDPKSGKVSAGIDTAEEFVTMDDELNRANKSKEDAREGPVGLGYRVPLVIASPWSRGGWVNSEVCDITSVLMFMENFLNKKTGKSIKETNISDWRRTVSGNLVSVFRPYNGEKINLPEFLQKEPFVQEIYNAKFRDVPAGYASGGKKPVVPQQEPGTRDACPIPYELYVDGKLSTGKSAFELEFQAANQVFGDSAAGAPFNVYAPGRNEWFRTRAYAVRAGDLLRDKWELRDFEKGEYHLGVYGPNGFYRKFKGSVKDPEMGIKLMYENVKGNPGKLTGNLVLAFGHTGKAGTYTIVIRDLSYGTGERTIELKKAGATATAVFDLTSSFGWYDLEIKVEGFPQFDRQFAGRVETGQPGKTDPLMGAVVTSQVAGHPVAG